LTLLRSQQCWLWHGLPRNFRHLPDWRIDGHIHDAREDREAVIAMIGTRIIPGVHLPDRHTHLLEYVFLLDPGAHKIRLDLFNEFLKFVAGHIVIDQRAILHIMLGCALIIVVMAKFITGSDDFHAEILIGANYVTRTKTADKKHNGFAFEAGPVSGDERIHQGLIFRDDALGTLFDLVIEEGRDLTQRFCDLGGTEEVIFAPRNTILLFHVPRDVVHRAVAMQHIELGLRGCLELGQTAVSRPLRDHAQAHFLEQNTRRPGITTDVVITDNGNVVRRGFEPGWCIFVNLVENPIPDRVIGDVMAERLRHATEAFATNRHDRLAVIFLGLRFRDRFNIVADQADWAFRLNGDAVVQREEVL